MSEHELKTDTPAFEAILDGQKTFELRKDDRGYRVGDQLRLRETKHSGEAMEAGAPLEYSGREVIKAVSHVQRGYGLLPGWVCLSLAPASTQPGAGVSLPSCFARICAEELERRKLTSHPLKLAFAKQRGMSSLDEVHSWMIPSARKFENAVREAGVAALGEERGEA
ncbi:DUF3850 domain-containing protein [Cupriavidus sp. TMH.W2]|uniref:DUF3850 domain-containing protein n=1 Tax=Cupriavidus sp. TMH.W2 TaxID=3434465 RepID=UPI003D77BE46